MKGNCSARPCFAQPGLPQPNPEGVEQQQDDREQAEESADETNVETDDNDDAVEVPVVEEPQPGKFAVIFTFFSTLMSSIIPEQPQVV